MIPGRFILFSFFFAIIAHWSCTPKEPLEEVEFKHIQGITFTGTTLHGNAVFHNPNTVGMKLKRIKIDVFVDGKKTAIINQKLKLPISPKSDFTVPVEAELSLKEVGLADALFSVLGGKRLEIRYKGQIRGNYKGFPVFVPVDYKTELRLKL